MSFNRREYQRKWTKTPKRQAYLKKYRKTDIYKASHYKGVVKWMKDNIEKVKAHAKAKRNRSFIKKDFCEDCGVKECLQMHHEDYTKPLEVITLCSRCHAKLKYEK
jgi:hypothetical protein